MTKHDIDYHSASNVSNLRCLARDYQKPLRIILFSLLSFAAAAQTPADEYEDLQKASPPSRQAAGQSDSG